MDVHLINTPALASTAIASIAPQPIIYLDCEGSDLGAIDGTLSLLSIGIPSPHPNPDSTSPLSPRIYLFDTLSLPLPSLSHLLALLASPNTLKLVWDGRQDFSELFHRFNTPLTNVVDLQLVDIHSRSVRKETDIDRLRRISLKCHPMWQVGLLETDGIHGLVGLKRAPREHMVYTADLDSEGNNITHLIILANLHCTYLRRPALRGGLPRQMDGPPPPPLPTPLRCKRHRPPRPPPRTLPHLRIHVPRVRPPLPQAPIRPLCIPPPPYPPR
ncbi:hypothetical protein BDV98DRAFT_325075 [Pterulicium gracile]|uniref:3'-5' exonuclease domain-containing protein n=1 Tax=Pterulicium gracile TaxID=1884261 RepID=A0A5C3QTC3_9AGAR|nr:hypothetical protein BDV98DRAFT_325075 [Pterula gracilis]